MTKDDLDAIAKRETHCKPWGEAVTISRAERDQLVALARRYLALRDADPDEGEPVPMIHERSDWGQWVWMPLQGEALDKRLDPIAKEEA